MNSDVNSEFILRSIKHQADGTCSKSISTISKCIQNEYMQRHYDEFIGVIFGEHLQNTIEMLRFSLV